MVDLLPYVEKILEPTEADVELSYKDLEAEIPLIVLQEISNTAKAAPDGVELLSDITIQLDMYAFTEQEVRELAVEVSRILTGAGFRRTMSEFVKEDNLPKQVSRFSTTVDEISGRLYRGADY